MVATSLSSSRFATEAGLQQTVDDLTHSSEIALARIWLLQSDDTCEVCRSRVDRGPSNFGLHLTASGGRSQSLEQPEVWNRLDGVSHRFPLNGQKIGRIGATGEPLIIPRAADEPALTNPTWLARENIQSFFGFPLIHSGRVLGVLAVFLRRELDDRDINYLRQIAAGSARMVAAMGTVCDQKSQIDQLAIERSHLHRDWQSAAFYGPLIARGSASRKWDQQIHLAAANQQPVLITGEPGSGKEFTARCIHQRCPNAREPFTRMDSATDAKRIEAWLTAIEARSSLGHSDSTSQIGIGTLFLDGIERLPLSLQSRLAAWIVEQSRQTPANLGGSVCDRPRLVASCGPNLLAEIAGGRLQRELYFALSVTEIAVPPLRNRLDDLSDLASEILQQIAHRDHQSHFTLDAAALDWLKHRDWPRNVRQLRHVLEDLAWRTANIQTDLQSATLVLTTEAPPFVSAEELKRQERANVLACLERCQWKVYGRGGAAEMLGLKPTTLMYRMKALGISKPKS